MSATALPTQTNIVHVNGKRAVYLAILKHADASTLAVVDAARAALPEIQAAAPDGLELKLDFDQSVFVRAAVENVIREAIISSILVSALILVFLGSWRNTVVVSTSIPLSIFAGIIGLFLTGNTINLMTLGGLALAIGLLVDNATVTIENIHRNLSHGKPLTVAILDGSAEVIQPLTVATLAICIVFFPVVMLFGVARYLFIPLAATVVFCMLASYALSFTVVPSFARFLLASAGDHHAAPKGLFGLFDRGFDRFRGGYGWLLEGTLRHRAFVLVCFAALLLVTGGVAGTIGLDFFPIADVGLIKLHYRAPPGTRIEDTEKQVLQVEAAIRKIIPATELDTINDTVGVPSSFNLAFVPSDNVGEMDAEILISLKPEHHPTIGYMRAIRTDLPQKFPGSLFYFQTADIVSQVLNFGLPAPLDVQIQDVNFNRSYVLAQRLLQRMKTIPGVADPHLVQVLNYPGAADRRRPAARRQAGRLAARRRQQHAGLAVVLGVGGAELLPQPAEQRELLRRRADADQPDQFGGGPDEHPGRRPRAAGRGGPGRAAGCAGAAAGRHGDGVSAFRPGIGEPLHGAARARHRRQRRRARPGLDRRRYPGGDQRHQQGPADHHAHLHPRPERGDAGLVPQPGAGHDPGGDPGLRAAGDPVPVLGRSVHHHDGGARRADGDHLDAGAQRHDDQRRIADGLDHDDRHFGIELDPGGQLRQRPARPRHNVQTDPRAASTSAPRDAVTEAVVGAGTIRLRPVLMTALAMIIGMVPMALGLGEAGEQNAPLGRAVIGGLIVATFATLFIVPIFYTLLRRKPPTLHMLDTRFAAEAAGAEAGGQPPTGEPMPGDPSHG